MARILTLALLSFLLVACDSISGMFGGEEEAEATPETDNPPEVDEALEQAEELQAAAEQAAAEAQEQAQAALAEAQAATAEATAAAGEAAEAAGEAAEAAGEAVEAAGETAEAAVETAEAAGETAEAAGETAMVVAAAEGGGDVQGGMLGAAGGRGTLAACESESDPQQCVIDRLGGRNLRYATEMAALISAYSAKGRGAQAVPIMQDFLRRFPTDRRSDRYRRNLTRMGIQPAR